MNVTAWSDVRVGARGLARDGRLALVAIGVLGLGIGLATAVLSVGDTVVRRGMPVADPDRLVVLFGATRDGRVPNYPFGLAEVDAFTAHARAPRSLGFYAYQGATPRVIREGDQVSRLNRALVSGSFFEVLGAHPILGRTLLPQDDEPGAARVVVLSHALWTSRYGGDSSVVGRTFHTYEDDVSHTIVGVMLPGLDFPRSTDFWTPVRASTSAANVQFTGVHAVARLRDGTGVADARSDVETYFAREDAPAWQRDLIGRAESLVPFHLGEVRPALVAFAAAVVLLLLVTCINVANLMLLRGARQARDVAVRMALGARRIQAVSAMLGEGFVLALGGLGSGLVVATAALAAVARYAPVRLAALETIDLNATALAGAVLITVLATLSFAVIPAWLTSRLDPQEVLKAGARSASSGRRRLLPDVLVAGQIAIAIAVMAVAGVITRSLVHLERAELAFNPDGLVVAELSVRADRYADPERRRVLMEELTTALTAAPEVQAVSPVVAVPFAGPAGWDGRPATESQTVEEAAANAALNLDVVAPSYFATLGLPIEEGRAFTNADDDRAPLVTIVSRSAARAYWPGVESPIGRRLRMGAQGEAEYTVVGIVPDTRYRDLREARPTMYVPVRQNFAPFPPTTLLIRASVSSPTLAPALRMAVANAAPGVTVVSARPFAEFLDGPLAQPRVNAFVLALFGSTAALLACLGVFGVTAASVRRRYRELGIRMAVGATSRSIERLVLRRAMVVALVGCAGGIAIAVAISRVTAAMVYEVTPTDPATIVSAATVLVALALLAALAPARAAARIDPVRVLAADD